MNPIVFYDGECALCNHSVIFLLKKDAREKLRYTPLSSQAAKAHLGKNYEYILEKDAITLLHNDKLYLETEAIIQALRIIDKWRWLVALATLIPAPIRNASYRVLARHRSKIFRNCPIIPPEYSHLFL